jgi:hypothetical protein
VADDLIDLLGGGAEPPKKKIDPELNRRLAASLKRPGARDNKRRYDEPERIKEGDLPPETEFMRPVGITFLAKIFGKQPYQISKRLAKCPIIGWHEAAGRTKAESPLYDFVTALSYLVTPKGDIEAWFGQQNAASLPPFVNKMWWDSAHQRNRVMRSSGQLWHDDEVRIVLSRVDMTIRQEVKMWIEDLPEKDLLSDKQYNALVDATNRLIEDIRKSLVEMPRETLSMANTIKDELEVAGGNENEETDSTADDQ